MNIKTEFASGGLEISYPIGMMAWDEAIAAEWSDGWRVPNRWELVRLFDEATGSGYRFNDKSPVWSASLYAPDPTGAWNVHLATGHSYANNKTYGNAVRLVREVEK